MLNFVRLLVLVVWLVGSEGKAQLRGMVTDAATGAPVAYANIQIENGNSGTTTAEDGTFKLDTNHSGNLYLVVTSVGYERKRIQATTAELKIKLTPQPLLLPEVTVRRPKGKSRTRMVGGFKKSKLRSSFGIGSQSVSPWVIARFYPYNSLYEHTPFFQEIELVVWSAIPNAKFRLRLLQVTSDGSPGKDLLATPVTATASKGSQVVKVLLHDHNVQVPTGGFFVAFEWMLISSNRNQESYTAPDGTRRVVASYEPTLAGATVSTNQNTWLYRGGNWSRNNARHKDNTYTEPQYRILLSE